MVVFLYAPQNFRNLCVLARTLEVFGQRECFVYDPYRLIRDRYGKSRSREQRVVSVGAFENILWTRVEVPSRPLRIDRAFLQHGSDLQLQLGRLLRGRKLERHQLPRPGLSRRLHLRRGILRSHRVRREFQPVLFSVSLTRTGRRLSRGGCMVQSSRGGRRAGSAGPAVRPCCWPSRWPWPANPPATKLPPCCSRLPRTGLESTA